MSTLTAWIQKWFRPISCAGQGTCTAVQERGKSCNYSKRRDPAMSMQHLPVHTQWRFLPRQNSWWRSAQTGALMTRASHMTVTWLPHPLLPPRERRVFYPYPESALPRPPSHCQLVGLAGIARTSPESLLRVTHTQTQGSHQGTWTAVSRTWQLVHTWTRRLVHEQPTRHRELGLGHFCASITTAPVQCWWSKAPQPKQIWAKSTV